MSSDSSSQDQSAPQTKVQENLEQETAIEKLKKSNAEKDEMMDKLRENDARLSQLLIEAADALQSLLPHSSSGSHSEEPHRENPDIGLITAKGQQGDQATPGPKLFEEKAQNWFATLNEVQTALRSGVRHLRASQLPALTPPHPAFSAAGGGLSSLSGIGSSIAFSSNTNQALSELGSAGRGHDLALLDSLVSTETAAGSRNGKRRSKNRSKNKITVEGVSKASQVIQAELQKKEDTASLSLSALRAQKQSWTDLRISLEEIAKSQNLLKEESAERSSDEDIKVGGQNQGTGNGNGKGKNREIVDGESNISSRRTSTPNDPDLNVHLTEEQIDQMKKAQLDQLKYDYATTDARLLDALFNQKVSSPFLSVKTSSKPSSNLDSNQQEMPHA